MVVQSPKWVTRQLIKEWVESTQDFSIIPALPGAVFWQGFQEKAIYRQNQAFFLLYDGTCP